MSNPTTEKALEQPTKQLRLGFWKLPTGEWTNDEIEDRIGYLQAHLAARAARPKAVINKHSRENEGQAPDPKRDFTSVCFKGNHELCSGTIERLSALSDDSADALTASGNDSEAWLDISDENAQIVQDAFNRRPSVEPQSLSAEQAITILRQCKYDGRTDWYINNVNREYLNSTNPHARVLRVSDAQVIAAYHLSHGKEAK